MDVLHIIWFMKIYKHVSNTFDIILVFKEIFMRKFYVITFLPNMLEYFPLLFLIKNLKKILLIRDTEREAET